MPLHLPKPPKKAELVVQEALAGLLSQPHSNSSLTGSRTADLTFALPLRIYFAGVDSIVARTLVTDAVLSGWRYLILDGNKPLFTVRLSVGARRKLEFSHISNAPFANATVKALRGVDKLPQIKKNDFELSQLEVPGLGIVALWFHSTKSDRFMPLPPVTNRLEPYKLYTEKAFISALRGAAIRKLQIKDARA